MTWKDLTKADLDRMKQLEADFRYTQAEMLEAVKDPHWQNLRVTLKGMFTTRKLVCLYKYKFDAFGRRRNHNREREIQVNNYLDALRRGGQLPPKGWRNG